MTFAAFAIGFTWSVPPVRSGLLVQGVAWYVTRENSRLPARPAARSLAIEETMTRLETARNLERLDRTADAARVALGEYLAAEASRA